MSNSDAKPFGNRILIGMAAFVSMGFTETITLFVSRASRDKWQVVFPAVVAFPYVFLILRMATRTTRDRLGAVDRGLSRGLGWTHVGLWIVGFVDFVVSIWMTKGSLGYVLIPLAIFLYGAVVFSVPFFLCQVMLIRADGQIGLGRDFWMGFALPWACAVATSGGIYTKHDGWKRREELLEQQRREEADKPRREAAEARARALQALPRGEVAWEIDVGESPHGVALAQRADGELYVTGTDRVIAVRRPRGIRWSVSAPMTIEEAALGPSGGVYVGSRERVSNSTDEIGPGKLLALDSRGEQMWRANVCGSHPYPAIVTSTNDVVVPCSAPGRRQTIEERLLTAVSATGDLKWSVPGAVADGGAETIHEIIYVVGRSVVDVSGSHKYGPQKLFAIDQGGSIKWTAPVSSPGARRCLRRLDRGAG